jgi:hypothetical protein
MRGFLRQHGPIFAFVILAIVGGIAIEDSSSHAANTLYKSQIASCDRQNQVRNESNLRIPSHNAEKEIVRALLVTAKAAREASGSSSDKVAAASYDDLIRQLDSDVHFRKIPLINCTKIIKKP